MIYKMGLQNKYYKLVDQGNKIVELRLYDQKRKKLKVGNLIRFYEEPERINYIDTIITKLNKYNSFSEALENINMNLLTNESEEKYLDDLENYYKKEEQAKYGVIAITISKVLAKEKSCGVIVIKNINGSLHILLVHHNLGHWGIPKGHIEDNETEEETAIREVLEETNINTKIISDFRKCITYSPKKNVMKDVIFFIGKPINDNLNPQLKEVNDVAFVDIDKALELITFDDEKESLREAISYIKDNNLKY